MHPKPICLLAAVIVSAMAYAEDTKTQPTTSARCDREVREYFDALKFIRDSAGAQISGRVAAGLVDERAVRKVQDAQGSCAAAQLIRERMNVRHS